MMIVTLFVMTLCYDAMW